MKGRLEYLDALRGFAALMVVFYHALQRELDPIPLNDVVSLGRLGVLVFFLLSGFVVPYSLRTSIGEFAWRRAIRILPALWVSVAAFLLLRGPQPIEVILANLTMVAQPLGLPMLTAPYWTLTYELGFYIACAALFAFGQLRNPVIVGLIVAGAAVLSLFFTYQAWLIVGFLFEGLLLRMAAERQAKALPWAVAGAVLLAGIGYFTNPPTLGFATPAVAIGLFIALAWWRPAVPRWMVWLGAISYPVYLFQGIPLQLIDEDVVGHFYVPAVLWGAVVIGFVVHEWVEKPCAARSKARRESPVAASSEAG